MTVRTSTAGEKTVAVTAAPSIAAAVPAAMHVFVPVQSFSILWHGQHLGFEKQRSYAAETALKSAIQATDADVVWST